MKHTAGSWRVDRVDQNVVWSGESRVAVAGAKYDWRGRLVASAEANARLIAAAPDLLDAAREALDALRRSGGTIDGAVAAKLEAAITKAEGRS